MLNPRLKSLRYQNSKAVVPPSLDEMRNEPTPADSEREIFTVAERVRPALDAECGSAWSAAEAFANELMSLMGVTRLLHACTASISWVMVCA